MQNAVSHYHQNDILPYRLYAEYLTNINNVFFTKQEITAISYITAGHTIKKIAHSLNLSPRTISTHLRNIMLKLACNSQEKIVDFIEKSGKGSILREYYLSLLAQQTFEVELKKIASLKKMSPTCILINKPEQATKPLIDLLIKHLQLSGINIIAKKINDFDSASTHDYIIYNIPAEEEHRVDIITEINILLQHPLYTKKAILFLKMHQNSILPLGSSNISCLSLLEQENYYVFVWNILEKIFYNQKLEKNVLEFTKKINALTGITAPYKNISSSLQKNLHLNTKTTKLLSLGQRLTVLVFSIGLGFIIFSWHQKSQQFSQPNSITQTTNSLKNNILTWNLPRQDHKFIGREKLLAKLTNSLHTAEDNIEYVKNKTSIHDQNINALVISACAGLGGIGKTQLALQYIRHAKYPYNIRAWFPAENLDELGKKYVEFAKMLGYKEDNSTVDKVITYIKTWLLNNPGWLLVFDNVNNYDEISRFLPEQGGYVILTTRHQQWPSGFKTMNINIMTEEESIKLIKSLIKRQISPIEGQAVKELINMLGYLPLALAQAGSYMYKTKTTIVDYLNLYKQLKQELLADNTLPIGNNILPVAITWDISLAAIRKEAQTKNEPLLALELLTVCSYLAPEKISTDLLLTWLKEIHSEVSAPELVLSKSIGQLWEYSMVNRDTDKTITVHRLVQETLRHKHSISLNTKYSTQHATLTLEWYHSLLKCVDKEFNRKTATLEDEARQKSLLPHLQMLLTIYKQLWPNNSELVLAPIISDIGEIFSLSGDPKTAKSYYEHALLILEQCYGNNNIKLANLINKLGKEYCYLGQLKKSLEFHERALNIQEQYYEKDHIEIAQTLQQLGRNYRYLGKVQKAKEAHEHALRIKEQHYGTDHIETASILWELGRDYNELGNAQKAKELHEHALNIQETHYGKDHDEVSYYLDQLGRDHRDLGDAIKAKELHERALNIQKQYYKTDNFEIAHILDQLGRDHRALGDAKKAKNLHEYAMKLEEKYYGKDHIAIAQTLDQLGRDYVELGNAKKAKKLHERVLASYEEYYGPTHLQVAHILDQLSNDYLILKDTRKAKELQKRSSVIKTGIE